MHSFLNDIDFLIIFIDEIRDKNKCIHYFLSGVFAYLGVGNVFKKARPLINISTMLWKCIVHKVTSISVTLSGYKS